MNRPPPNCGVIIAFAVTFLAGPANAQSVWNPAEGSSWGTPGNWSGGSVPPANSDITISDAAFDPLILDVSRQIRNLSFGELGDRIDNFTIQSGPASELGISGPITATGPFSSNSNLLNLRGRFLWHQNQPIHVGGNDGNANGDDRGVRFRATEDELAAGSLLLNGDLTKTGTGQLQFIATSLSGPGNLLIGSGTLKLNAGAGLPLSVTGPGNLTLSNSARLLTARNAGSFGDFTRPIVMANTSSWVHGGGQGGVSSILSSVAWQNSQHSLDVARFLSLGGGWTGSVNVTVVKSGVGTLALTGDNSAFAGTLRSDAGMTDRVRLEGPFGGHVQVDGGVVAIHSNVTGSVMANNANATVAFAEQAVPPTVGGNLAATSAKIAGEALVAGNISLSASKLSVVPESVASCLKATGDLTLSGSTEVILRGVPVSGQAFAVLEYGGSLQLGAGGTLSNRLQLAGGNSNYRGSPAPAFVANAINPKRIDVAVTTASIIWTGVSSGTWSTAATGNWTGASPAQFRHLDAVTFNDNTTRTTVTISGGTTSLPALFPGVITFDNSTAKTFTIAGSSSGTPANNCLSGGATIIKNGTGTVILGGGDNQDFTGDISVNAGILKMGSHAAFGKSPAVHVGSGGQVDLGGMKPATVGSGDFTFHIEGAGPGPGFEGALVNSVSITSGSPPGSDAGVRSLILDGDATISSRGRYDVGFDTRGGRGIIKGNSHLLTVKTDTFDVNSVPDGRTGMAFMGDASGSEIRIRVAQGVLWAQDCDDAFGGADSTLTIASGARAGTFGSRRIPVQVVVENGGMIHCQGNTLSGTGTWTGSVNLQGHARFNPAGHRIVMAGNIAQATGTTATLTKEGNGVLALAGDGSYTGLTTVESGTLLADGHLGKAGSAPVSVSSGATLGGNGRIQGEVTIDAGGMIAPGDATTTTGGTDSTGKLRTGAIPTLAGSYIWEIDRWDGIGAGTDWDLLETDSLDFNPPPLIVIASKPGDFKDEPRTFAIATSSTPITGFNAATNYIDSSAFQWGTLPWSLALSSDGRTLLLRYGVGATTAFSTWASSYGFTGSNALALGNPDGDGFTNLEEFLFGTSPDAATGALVNVSQSGPNLELRWFQRSSGSTYVPQQSSTLAEGSWTNIAGGSSDIPIGTPSGYTRITLLVPISGPRRFVRITGR